MKKLILVLSLIALLSSCKDIRIESTSVLHERAVVVTTLYSPSEHRTELTNTMIDNGVIGTDYSGDQGVKVGKNLQITTTTIPEKYGAVFQCQHGTFTIEGSEQKYRILYNKLYNSIRDTVDILYKEQYQVTYEEDKTTKKSIETKRVLNKLDFIDAQIVGRN